MPILSVGDNQPVDVAGFVAVAWSANPDRIPDAIPPTVAADAIKNWRRCVAWLMSVSKLGLLVDFEVNNNQNIPACETAHAGTAGATRTCQVALNRKDSDARFTDPSVDGAFQFFQFSVDRSEQLNLLHGICASKKEDA